jgi:glycogen synthase
MNILQISQSFYPCFDSGGVVRAVYEISKELVAQGHDVTVYTTDGCTKRLDVEKNEIVTLDGIKVYYFSNLSNKLKIRLKVATPYHLFKIIRSVIKNFDIIHIHEHCSLLR